MRGILTDVSSLNPTPPERMVDAQGRPYFLRDVDMTLARFRELLNDPDPDIRAYAMGKLLRQAKPDDVFTFVTVSDVRTNWERVAPFLGRTREFWRWLLDEWGELGVA
ncbi:MAG: hypothetical protein HOP15_03805 [Planctomycetes bacterium]|nr:hypothetical protein [Planctomycetota bacterium]